MKIITGDCLEVMPTLDAESVDSIVTDPPYGLSFMGKHWDHGIPGVDFWREALRVAKPGAHLLAFGGTRTFHRLTCAIEDAGWEIRDCIMWVYGSGFTKSLDVSKAIDKAAGVEREVVGSGNTKCEYLLRGEKCQGHKDKNGRYGETIHTDTTAPATPAAVQWNGWGTALKPAWEPIIVARKPLCGTVAANVLEYGTGGINVDGCRVGETGARNNGSKPREDGYQKNDIYGKRKPLERCDYGIGRFPANLCHDGSAEVTRLMGDAARFFYCAKASKSDRDELNHHPTVKPTALMRWLVRLVTPPGGLVFDPFCGSGSTGKAATLEGFRFVGIEREAEYAEIAEARINAVKEEMLF